MGKELQSAVLGALLSASMLLVTVEQEKTWCCCKVDVRSSLYLHLPPPKLPCFRCL